MPAFVELRAHSCFSFGDGSASPQALVRRAAELGYPALGLTDSADLGGAIRFTLEANQAGIKPIVGAELLVDGHPTAFLARNAAGYRNLAALVTRARVGDLRRWEEGGGGEDGQHTSGIPSTDGHDNTYIQSDGERRRIPAGWGEPVSLTRPGSGGGRSGAGRAAASPGLPPHGSQPPAPRTRDLRRPRGQPGLTFEDLTVHAEGLWCLTGPATGEIATYLRTGRAADAVYQLERWRDLFGSKLAVEVQLHHAGGHEAALAAELIQLAERSGLPWVVANDPRYLDGAGRLVHDLLVANRADVTVDTAASWGLLLPNGEWRLKSPREMAVLWQGRERGLEAAAAVASDCGAFDLRWLRPPMPRFQVPEGETDHTHMRALTYAGARERWGELDARQEAQLEHELGVIGRLGFDGFFLVMYDAIRFARERGILCQGRGSAANSAVAYCLGITAVDPVRHGLLFERFLSEVRTDGMTEAPDIDVDFEMHRREEVLDYMYSRYDRSQAAITAVHQEYHAPSALQDCMRALGYQAEQAFALSKRIHGLAPSEGAARLREGLAEAQGLDLTEPRARALLAALEGLDDVVRMRSTHPGGFVLSDGPLGAWMPIEHTTMGRTILQFDKDDLDAAGVPKFDFLGLGGLSAVHLAFDAIERRTGEYKELYNIPVDDAATYDLIQRGETVGTFQIESRAQIQSILQTEPTRLYDIVVQVALIRPGPIQARFVHPYTERRLGRAEVHYEDPRLEPILRRTYGVPIFQEQAMAISMALGGFSAAEADELRRAMGHKRKLPRLHAALENLRLHMEANGVNASVAEQIVEDLHSFANYGFPESHAWSFALIAYATAYLKANYPAEFYLGLLNAWPMGFYPPATLVHDARRHGVNVLGPCLKVGAWDCTIEPLPSDVPAAASPETPSVRGLAEHQIALRVGWRHIRGLGERARQALQEAHAAGPFASIQDVVRRAGLQRAEALHLARAGAFEAFAPGRRKAAWEALRAAGDLLPLAPARHLPFDPAELEGEELVFLDYLATGISVHGHPMDHMRERLAAAGVTDSRGLEDLPGGARVVVAGLVVARQHPETAKGTVFVLLEDEHGFMNVIVPAKLYERNREV
ncbi:MAG: DNA polymerase III subunit alpha, partial [Gemmatimonadota bacterium]